MSIINEIESLAGWDLHPSLYRQIECYLEDPDSTQDTQHVMELFEIECDSAGEFLVETKHCDSRTWSPLIEKCYHTNRWTAKDLAADYRADLSMDEFVRVRNIKTDEVICSLQGYKEC